MVLKELNLTSLPSGIWGQLTQLKVLSLRDNKLSQIPDDMGNLKKLLFLGLRKNKFTEIPAGIGELESLITLSIGDNKFDEQIQLQIPNEMMGLANFKHLHLEQNRLTEIPAGIEKLEKLELLDLSFNELTIDPSLSYKKLPIDPSLSLKQKGSLCIVSHHNRFVDNGAQISARTLNHQAIDQIQNITAIEQAPEQILEERRESLTSFLNSPPIVTNDPVAQNHADRAAGAEMVTLENQVNEEAPASTITVMGRIINLLTSSCTRTAVNAIDPNARSNQNGSSR